MRGKACWSLSRCSFTRITPACAGKSYPWMGQGYTVTGSPPRVRGKARTALSFLPLVRITPACAGKSFSSSHNDSPLKDHPRVCGEKPQSANHNSYHQGITPACAGKRYHCHNPRYVPEDHPRVCGEKLPTGVSSITPMGSPPRVRGKGYKGLMSTISGGITPACAGKRKQKLEKGGDRKDHPRVCGEKPFTLSCPVKLMGSPPRVRGKDLFYKTMKGDLRITPACAGKSSAPIQRPKRSKDHPRVCGEKR